MTPRNSAHRRRPPAGPDQRQHTARRLSATRQATTTQLLHRLTGLLAVAALLAGPPIFLVTLIGNPWPAEGVAWNAPLTDHAVIGALAVLLWILWAQLATCLAVELYAAITDRAVPIRLPVLTAQGDLARVLVGLIIATTVAAPLATGLATNPATADGGPRTHGQRDLVNRQGDPARNGAGEGRLSPRTWSVPGGANAAPRTADTASAGQSHSAGSGARTFDPTPPQTAQSVRVSTLTVSRGDTLWSLAETHLGDGERWPDIAALNDGRRMLDGTTFRSADNIRPGWRLHLPTTSRDASPTDPLQEPTEGADTSAQRATARSYEVQTGDTLWDIADTQLGDPTRYPDIANASRHRTQPDGTHLDDPDHIEPGWTVTLPNRSQARPETPHPDRQQPLSTPRALDKSENPSGPQEQPEPSPAPPSDPPAPEAVDQRADGAVGETDDTPGSRSATQGADGNPDDAVADAHLLDADWVQPGLTGAGGLLAASLLLGLRARRRTQHRWRRPGRLIPAPGTDLEPTEMTLLASGSRSTATVTFLDTALRLLAEHAHEHRTAMPHVAAAHLTKRGVVLHLTEPHTLPEPWRPDTEDPLRWFLSTTTDLDALTPPTAQTQPPYPMLVTVGTGPHDDPWMLNLEELGSVDLTGDPDAVDDFVRHLVAQLAVNPWSRDVTIECAGLAHGTDRLSDQVHRHPDLSTATAAATNTARTTLERARRHDVDLPTARSAQADDDLWPAHIVFVARSDGPATAGSSNSLHELHRLVVENPQRTSAALITANGRDRGDTATGITAGEDTRPTRIHLSTAGDLIAAPLPTPVAAVQLSQREAEGCADLYSVAEQLEDSAPERTGGSHAVRSGQATSPTPDTSAHLALGAQAAIDLCVQDAHTAPPPDGVAAKAQDGPPEPDRHPATSRSTATVSVPANLHGDSAADAINTSGPPVPDDLLRLMPRPSASVQEPLGFEDTLETDLADWYDDTCRRPKITLLGPVTVRAHGKPLAKYKAVCIELVCYLALHPDGATRDQIADALGWADPARVRKYVNVVRDWLGTHPQTGTLFLPHADKSPAALTRGINTYQLSSGVLTDLDLLRRLLRRGQADAESGGVADHLAALRLVTGTPFTHLREGGWAWLAARERHDLYTVSIVADASLYVVNQALDAKDYPLAEEAARIGLVAAPDHDPCVLAAVAVMDAMGNPTAASALLNDRLLNPAGTTEPADDLPTRTQELLERRRWLAG